MRAHKTYSLLIFVLLTSLCMGVMAQNPGRQAFSKAENLRKGKRYEEAISQYDEAIRLEPENYRYYFSKGKAYYAMKDYDQALFAFEETVQKKPDFVFAYTLIAKIYRKKNEKENAIYYYDLAFKAENEPKRKVGYKMEAVKLLLQDGNTEEAQRHLTEVKQVAPDNLNILYFDAKISNQNGDHQNALNNMLTATSKLESAPPAQSAKYWYELGYAYNQLDDYQNAQKAWEKAYFGRYKTLIDRERSKNSPAYFYRLAVSYYMTGNYTESKEQIDKALELQNNFSAAYMLLGRIYKKQGDMSSAISNYRSAAGFEQDPNKKVRLQMMLASMQLDFGDFSGAVNSAEEVLSKQSNNSKMMFVKAQAQYTSGQYGSAISTLETLLSSASDSKSKAKANFIIGMAAKNTDVERAKNAFKDAMVGPYKPAAENEYSKLTGKAG